MFNRREKPSRLKKRKKEIKEEKKKGFAYHFHLLLITPQCCLSMARFPKHRSIGVRKKDQKRSKR